MRGEIQSFKKIVVAVYLGFLALGGSAADFPNCTPVPWGLVGWWPGEGDASDRVGGTLGVLHGGVDFVSGETGNAFRFQGEGAAVEFSASPTLNIGPGPGLTIECWIKPDDLSTNQPLVEWNNGPAPGVHLWVSVSYFANQGGPGSLFANIVDNQGNTHALVSGPGVLTTNQFSHVALTYNKDNGLGIIYVNGVIVYSYNLGIFTPQTSYNLLLGRRPPASFNPATYSGLLDEVSLYNRPLTQSEIQDIYHAGVGGKCAAPVIVQQPIDLNVAPGEHVGFVATVVGLHPLYNQWSFNGSPLQPGADASLSFTNIQLGPFQEYSVLTFLDAQPRHAGVYSVQVTNAYGTATSANVTLSVQTRSYCSNAPAGMVGWFRAEGNATNLLGNEVGQPIGNVAYATGETGTGFQFDGSSGYIKIPASPALDVGLSGGLTIECWIKPSDLAHYQPIVEWNDGQNYGVHLWISEPYWANQGGPGDIFANVTDDQGTTHALVSAPGLLATNEFNHIALTYDKASGVGSLYINANVVYTYNLGTFTPQTSYDLLLGRRPPLTPYPCFYGGILDELSLYNRALTAQEVRSVFTAGSAGKCAMGPLPPQILRQPSSLASAAGGNATLSVAAVGTPPLYYQWSFKGLAIAQGTAPVLNLTNIDPAENGAYSVLVSNALGSVLSGDAILTVYPAPTNCVMPPDGIVSWWRAESDGLDALSLNNAFLLDGVSFTKAKVNSGFAFRGGHQILVQDSPTLNFGQDVDFSIESWVRVDSSTNSSELQAIVQKLLTSDAGRIRGYSLYLQTGRLACTLADGTSVPHEFLSTSPDLRDGQFHQVALTVQRNSLLGGSLYVDGQPVLVFNTATVAGDISNSAFLTIGSNSESNTNTFVIDELSIYHRNLLGTEIRSIYAAQNAGKCQMPFLPQILSQPNDQSLVPGETAQFKVLASGSPRLSYQWRFNGVTLPGATSSTLSLINVQPEQSGKYRVLVENSYGSVLSSEVNLSVQAPSQCVTPPPGLALWWSGESTLADSVAGNTGLPQGSVAFSPGKVGKAFDLNGSSSILINDSDSTTFTNTLSFEGWIYPRSTSGHHHEIVSKWEGGFSQCSYTITIVPDGRFAAAISSDGSSYSTAVVFSAQAVPNLTWTHVACVYDGKSLSLYLNGELTGTQPWNLGIFPGHAPFILGSTFSSGSFFDGLLDELSLYRRALSSEDIRAIFRAGAAGKCAGVAPYFVSQPASLNVDEGETARFTAVALGNPPLNYQWIFNATDLAGATNSELVLPNAASQQAGRYQVRVTNSSGSITSTVAVLTINARPECAAPPSGITRWWRGEGNTTDTVTGQTGLPVNGVSFAAGKVGQAFDFNGSSAKIQVEDAPELRFTNALTVEAWIFPRSTNGRHHEVLSKWEGGPNQSSYTFTLVPDGRFAVGLSSDGSSANTIAVYARDAIPALTWTHVAGVYDGGSLNVYINGALSGSAPWTNGIFPGSAPLIIGSTLSSGSFFDGLIDELSVYNRGLSSNEIQTLYLSRAAGKCNVPILPYIVTQPVSQTVTEGETAVVSIVAAGNPPLTYQWFFNDRELPGATDSVLALASIQIAQGGTYRARVTNGSGATSSSSATLTVNPVAECAPPPAGLVSWWRGETNALDAVRSHEGTLSSGVTFTTGHVRNCFSFDGVSGQIVVPDSPDLSFARAMTFEAWIYPKTTRNLRHEILSKWDSPGNQHSYTFGLDADGRFSASLSADGTASTLISALSANPIPQSKWTHVAAVYDGSDLELYVDGLLSSTVQWVSGIFSGTAPLAIGSRYSSGLFFEGLLDEISLYGRALSAAEILSIRNAGSAGKCNSLLPPVILSQPQDQTVVSGAAVTFQIVVQGSSPLAYQWMFNGIALPGETNYELILPRVSKSQAGLYSAVVSNAIAGVISSNALLIVEDPPAALSISSLPSTEGGVQITVPVQFEANGNENAVSFSINFDPTILGFEDLNLGMGLTGATLLLNTSQTNNGRIGIAVALPLGEAFLAARQELVELTFDLKQVSTELSTALNFGDQPIKRQVADIQARALPAAYSNASLTVLATGYEGDVMPRPNGDHEVMVTDWIQIGRYAAKLDYPTNASEFQRADCAPRETLGDGVISVSDWVQAGRYAAGFDPMTFAGGPTPRAMSSHLTGSFTNGYRNKKGGSPERTVHIFELTAVQARTISIPVNLESLGDENALGFSLVFDPSLLHYTGTELGTAAPGAMLNLNETKANSGTLGVALALPISKTFAAGVREILRVNFETLPTISKVSDVSFDNNLVILEVSDSRAKTLQAQFIGGKIIMNPAPNLGLSASKNSLSLSWPAWGSNYVVQEAATLGTETFWTNLPIQGLVTNGQLQIPISPNVSSRFYRLNKR